MTRRAYVDHDKKCLLFWSQKSGCTSLVQWYVKGRLGLSQEETQRHGHARAWLNEEGYKLNYPQAIKHINHDHYKAVVLARHPASRVLSAYLNKFVVYNNKRVIKTWDDLEPFAQKELERWGKAPEENQPYDGLTFREFLDVLETQVEKAGTGYPKLDAHWNLQVPFNDSGRCIQYDKILYLEDFSSGVGWLNDFFGIDYKMPKTNRTKYQEDASTENLSDVKSAVLAASPDKLKKDNFLLPDILKQIHRIYKADYEVFGYDPMDIKKLPAANRSQPAVVSQKGPEPFKPLVAPDDEVPFEVHDNGAEKTVLAFGGLGQKVGVPVFEFRKALSEVDCNFVFFKDVCRSWYHSPLPQFGETFEEKGENLAKILGNLNETELYTVGSSAGGFAALLFGAFLPIKASLLFGPQVFIDKPTRRLMQDGRWSRLINCIKTEECRSIEQVAEQVAHPVNIVVGSKDDQDMKHALYARTFIDARIHVLTKAGHNPAQELKTAGVLGDVLKSFVDDGNLPEYRGLTIGQRKAALLKMK